MIPNIAHKLLLAPFRNISIPQNHPVQNHVGNMIFTIAQSDRPAKRYEWSFRKFLLLMAIKKFYKGITLLIS